MIFNESVCFDISVSGAKSDIKKLVGYLTSGEFDDFFEITSDFFSFDDEYENGSDDTASTMLFTCDEFGIEVDEFDSDDFLEMLCKAAKNLRVSGTIYNFDDDEYRFVSEKGDSYYTNASKLNIFNDELDEQASREEAESDEDADEE